MTDILQAVRWHGKIHVPVNGVIDVDQTLCKACRIGIIPFGKLRYRSSLITTIMIDGSIRVLGDHLHKLLPYVALVLVRIRPKGMMYRGISLTHQETNQVIESSVGNPFHIHKQFYRLSR